MSQNNTLPGGPKSINAGADLTDLEFRLVKIADAGSKPEVVLPTSVADITPYIVTQGAVQDLDCVVEPILTEDEKRVRANGTGSAGDILVLCDPAASAGVNAGKVEALGTTEGAYFSPGIALEDFVDEQTVRFRPHPRIVNVGTAFASATPVSTATTQSSPYGFATQAQGDAVVSFCREARAFLVAMGWKATS